VVLISGRGSNMGVLIDAVRERRLDAELVRVISNRANAAGLERAADANIDTAVINHRSFSERALFDQALAREIDDARPDLVVLAGFMRIFTAGFVEHFRGRMINIHPALLPRYPGLHTHERVLEAGDREHGASVHFVTEEVDGGPPIVEAELSVTKDDTADTLNARVLRFEHRLLPTAVHWFANGRLELADNGVHLDGELLGERGVVFRQDGETLRRISGPATADFLI
jgi:phosphoribosylglycinamide formyltransferase-1